MRPPHVFAQPSQKKTEELLGELRLSREARRAVGLLMSSAGYPASEIAAVTGCHPGTVRRLVAAFAERGLDALRDRPRPGRPREGGGLLDERLARLLEEPRAWTAARLRRALGTKLSVSTVRRRLIGRARWATPRLTAKGDAEAPAKWAAIWRFISGLPAGAVILAQDECHLCLLPWVRKTWVLLGRRQEVVTPGTNESRALLGAVDTRTGRWFYQVAKSANGAAFISLLEEIWGARVSTSSTGRNTRPTRTPLSASGVPSSATWQTPRRRRWRGD